MRTWDLLPGVKILRVNDYDMAYLERGSGPPLVLVHGAVNDYRTWEPQMGPLGERYRVIAVSLRHYYPERWDGKGDDFSITQHAADVAAFVRALGGGPVHLLGHSRGGNVVLHVAKADQSLLRTLILADASGLEVLLPKTSTVDATRGPAMFKLVGDRISAGDIDGGLEILAEYTTGQGAWKALTESQKQIRRDNAWTVAADTGDRPQTTCEEGSKIMVPTLLMNGEVSPERYPATSRLFQRCLPNQEHVSIAEASHGMFRTHPEASNAAVLSFLAKH